MSSERARRDRGVCRGTLTLQEKTLLSRYSSSDSSKTMQYCVLVGAHLSCYENALAFQRGDHAVTMVRIVGSSAWNPGNGAESTATFRLVTEQGTHLYCTAPTSTCRDLWLGALHAGLDRSLLEAGIPKQQPLQPPQPPKGGRLNFRNRVKRFCISCGAMDDPEENPIRVKCVPMPHYAKETRCDLCSSCLVAQGLLNHVHFVRELFASAQHERNALQEAKQLCWNAMKKANPNLEQDAMEAAAAAAATAAVQSSNASTTAASNSTTTTGEATHESSSSSSNGSSKESHASWSVIDDPMQHAWIHLPPTPESTKAVIKLITSSAEFLSLQRVSLTLETCCQQIQEGVIGVPDMLEQIENVLGTKTGLDQQAEMKKQAFRVAGDMGTAMNLLHDLALPRSEYQQQQQQHTNLDLFICLLEFLLDLCEDGELASVAAFWPQLCHIHLRMLPVDNIAQLHRVDLLEDFLLTVATRYSVHLALDLIWSHTADLEESLVSNTCSPKCRRRRYAVMRFVCELESSLFGYSGGWGGGSVSLRKVLKASPHQDELIKQYMAGIQEMRKSVPHMLTRSVRMDFLTDAKREKDPDLAVQEAMRIARNADYFSSHLNFTRRLCDIAEKMRFLDVKERASALEEELFALNASGAMGGDPLNRVMEHHIRVVGMPTKEGHVFRSKERTPVLILLEIFDDTVEDDQEQEQQHHDQSKENEQESITDVQHKEEMKEPESVETGVVTPPRDNQGLTSLGPEGNPLKTETKCARNAAEGTNDGKAIGNDGINHQVMSVGGPLGTSRHSDARPVDEDEMYSPKHARRIHGSADNDDTSSPSRSRNPSLPLEGSMDDSNNDHTPHALKRFDQEEEEAPHAPKMEKVEEMVTNAMVKQLYLPDLGEDGEGGGNAAQEEEEGAAAESIENKNAQEEEVSKDEEKRQGTMSHRETGDDIGNRKMSALSAPSTGRDLGGESGQGFAPTGDVRREVLNAIFLKGIQGSSAIATGTQAAVQLSLQELEHKRAIELLMHDSDRDMDGADSDQLDASYVEIEKRKKRLNELGLDARSDDGKDEDAHEPLTEEDEALESIRLLLIQNRVAQGRLSPVAAAKVLQNASLKRVPSAESGDSSEYKANIDMPKVDAGEVDPRLVGCGELPPAVLQALTLWKAGMVTNGELLELVKKDLEHGRHVISQDPEVVDKLKEDSAFWGRFAFGERWAEKKARIALSSEHGKRAGWDLCGVIIKSNDDLRQEAFVMQLIELCQEAFQVAKLELWVHPYRILATGRTTGIIEMVRNAMSFDALKKRPGYGKGGLREHLQRMTEFTADPGNAFKSAQRNFVRSLAAYSLMSYFFLFKDRHNGNILLDTAGHIIHIDFGFVFGIAPGGSFSLEMSTPFKLTEEMIDVMGGMESPLFSEFVILFCCGFLALQAHSETFITLVEITSKDSTFKCFEGKDSEEIVEKLRERFCPDLDTEKTIAFALDLIHQATSSYGTKQYDYFQYISQGIAS